MAGGWSKMSNEPLARECEPIERVRARFEALVKANAAPRCGARCKRTGKPCRAAAMPNDRCKVHGGKSTGPRTPEGLERSRRASWKHGRFSREAKAERSRVRAAILALRYLCIIGPPAVCSGSTNGRRTLEFVLPRNLLQQGPGSVRLAAQSVSAAASLAARGGDIYTDPGL